MGVNLVTRVRNFSMHTQTFTATDHDVQDGCVTPGQHRILRFDFLSYNAGDADLVIGSPAARPDLFVWSAGHGHYHLKDFNEFLLFRADGSLATVGYKQAFCAIDIERISPTASATGRFHDCNSNQGISAGWADVYNAALACQFIVIDGLPDGDYTLQSTTNTRHIVAEDCFGDNTMWTGLRLQGSSVSLVDPPFVPEDRIAFDRSKVEAVQVAGRWKVVEGGSHWMLDTGTNPWEAQRAVEIIKHYRLASMCFVGRPRCGDVEPMMYWLNDDGRAPAGHLDGEDCLPFDRASLEVVEIGGRWKIVEGTHWLLDFGPGQGNAIAALHVIRKHGFDQICFVGRPGPSMTYFKRAGRRHVEIPWIDPRRIDAAVEGPLWREEQAALVQETAPTFDFAAERPGTEFAMTGPQPLELQVRDAEGKPAATEIVARHGITGLATGGETEIRFSSPVDVVDIGVAHFGKPPSIVAHTADGDVVELAADPGQRQVENIRISAANTSRIVVTAGAVDAVLAYVRIQPNTTPRANG